MKHYVQFTLLFTLTLGCGETTPTDTIFTQSDLNRLYGRQLSLSMPPRPVDETNQFAHHSGAQALGEQLFNEAGLSGDGQIACVTCHDPDLGFSDGLSFSMGTGVTGRHAPHLFNVGFQRWFYWDGRADTLWGQALSPIEHPNEMNLDRVSMLHFIANHPEYGPAYEALFGPLPPLVTQSTIMPAMPMPQSYKDPRHQNWVALDEASQSDINRAFSNIGKALAAYQMTLITAPTPFDYFVEDLREQRETGLSQFSMSARRGLKLFMNEANCHLCHSGVLFSDREFHNLGFEPFDIGRTQGVLTAQASVFSSAGPYSDDPNGDKSIYLNALISGHITDGAFKTPSLRNIAMSPPYMHDGRFATLKSVVEFYNEMPPQIGPGDRELFLVPLNLSPQGVDDIVNFLHTLSESTRLDSN